MGVLVNHPFQCRNVYYKPSKSLGTPIHGTPPHIFIYTYNYRYGLYTYTHIAIYDIYIHYTHLDGFCLIYDRDRDSP